MNNDARKYARLHLSTFRCKTVNVGNLEKTHFRFVGLTVVDGRGEGSSLASPSESDESELDDWDEEELRERGFLGFVPLAS